MGRMSTTPLHDPVVIWIEEKPAAASPFELFGRLIDQGGGAEAQRPPQVFDAPVPASHLAIPETGEHQVMSAEPWWALVCREQHVFGIERDRMDSDRGDALVLNAIA